MTESSMLERIESMTFEEAMSEMEKTVKSLEDGNLSLEESLRTFEYGIHLSRYLGGKLKAAELKINELVEENGELIERSGEMRAPDGDAAE